MRTKQRTSELMATGLVTVWKHSYGFIKQPDGGADVFVHATALPQGRTHLVIGEVITFDIGTNERGNHAVNVQVFGGVEAEVEKAWASKDALAWDKSI
jgi:CspA family cold shock protein